MAYKTPGVYVEEISTFPPSVVPVETAIPAFIGYTEKALDLDSKDLACRPTRITSLLQFQAFFGGDFSPASFEVQLNTTNHINSVGSITPKDANGAVRRYYLYRCIRHFYANGGGPCYIVSVGIYPDEPILDGDSSKTPPIYGLRDGLLALKRFDEPTLLVFPDGVTLTNLGDLQKKALEQCGYLQDRFAILDLPYDNSSSSADTANFIADFREGVGTESLNYGAAYHPWVRTIYTPNVHFRDLKLVTMATDSQPIPDATLDHLLAESDDALKDLNKLVPIARNADVAVANVLVSVHLSAMAGDDKLTLNRDNFANLLKHFADLVGKLRKADSDAVSEPFGNLVLLARAVALAFPALDDVTWPNPEFLPDGLLNQLKQAIANLKTDVKLFGNDPEPGKCSIAELIALEKHVEVRALIAANRDEAAVNADYIAIEQKAWLIETDLTKTDAPTVQAIPADTRSLEVPDDHKATALKAADAIKAPFEKLAAAILSVFSAAEFLAGQAEKRLFDKHPVYRSILDEVNRTMSLLPPSGAVAGVYATVDRTRGVWKAPANVSLADVVGPAVKINDAGQADLNVTTTGKSINAIRSFAGKGTLIWGARTLAGNDNEWRYVPVRRFFNMAEESIKRATEPFVFEPNDANTWVRVRAMIENFLTVQWRQGALVGAATADAFYVKVGLGETMTALDILEGRMFVEVGMAVVRPAEFIILKFSHKMQVS